MEDLTKSVILQWGMLGVVIIGGALAIRALWNLFKDERDYSRKRDETNTEALNNSTDAIRKLTEVVKEALRERRQA